MNHLIKLSMGKKVFGCLFCLQIKSWSGGYKSNKCFRLFHSPQAEHILRSTAAGETLRVADRGKHTESSHSSNLVVQIRAALNKQKTARFIG